MKKVSAKELARLTYKENSPIDWNWVNQIKRQSNEKELIRWAAECCFYVAPDNTSKSLLTRAGKELIRLLF